MNRIVSVVSILAALSAISSCNSSNAQAPGTAPAPKVAAKVLPWKFNFKSVCAEGSDPTQCVGFYGFSVAADGTYSAGPAPAGQMLNGTLSTEEFATLSSAVAEASALVAVDANGADTCVESDAITTTDTVTLAHLTKSAVIAHQTGDQFCYKGGNAESSKALYAEIVTLAAKYYALPFPNACTDAALKVTSLYASLQSCKVDTDCAYVSADYETIAPDMVQYVPTDTCSVIAPMVVGNTVAVNNAMANLQQLVSTVQTTCGQQMLRSDCTQATGFTSTSASPVCGTDHMCHANPNVSSL